MLYLRSSAKTSSAKVGKTFKKASLFSSFCNLTETIFLLFLVVLYWTEKKGERNNQEKLFIMERGKTAGFWEKKIKVLEPAGTEKKGLHKKV